MLTIYRRHIKTCSHRIEGRKYRRCHCPIWADGFIAREEIRETLKTRNWEEAQQKIRDWEAERSKPQEPTDNRLTVDAACEKYLADGRSRQLGTAAIYKYSLLTRQIKAFAVERGVRFLEELDLDLLRDFRATWKNRNLSALKKLHQLKGFFRFCAKGGALTSNPALDLTAPIVKQPPTLPFERDEMARILSACDHLYIDNYRRVGQDNSKRIKALVLLLRYSGLRIGDAVTLPVSRIAQGKVFLRTAKTGTHITCPLPPLALDALIECPRTNPLYFFWTGQCSRGTLARDWHSKLVKLFKVAGIQNGHAHRFRDTFAVEALLAGTPLEQVAALLGHSSIKMTERHYSPWVKARQDQMEASVIHSWELDPLIVKQPPAATGKGTPEVHEKKLVN
ncbi:MAG: site-specific integrase [Terriglobia bacterium]|jgi:integrase